MGVWLGLHGFPHRAKLAQFAAYAVNVDQLILLNNLQHQASLWQDALRDGAAIGAFGIALEQLTEREFVLPWQNIHHQLPAVQYCPSSATRREFSVPATWQARSLPSLLTQALVGMSDVKISIILAKDCALARLDAMDLTLAALAMDLTVALWIEPAALAGLDLDQPKQGTKAFASLALFGLEHAFVESAPSLDFRSAIALKVDHKTTAALEWRF
jgi:hypothetical protein